MCTSMLLYFTWSLPPIYVNFITVIFVLPLLFKIKYKTNDLLMIGIVFLCYFYNFVHGRISISSLINNFFIIIITSFIIISNDSFKLKLYNYFDCFIKIICFISLIGWILFLLGVPLPHYYNETTDFYSHEVFYLFIMGANNFGHSTELIDIVPRFCGMFLEPGHIGSTACIMLYINKFNFRKRSNIIYLLSIILSLSLAAYCLFFIGLILYSLFRGKDIFRYLFWILVVGLVLVAFGLYYNGGDNIINEKILERLVIKDGHMAGDNRTTSSFDDYYKSWLENGNLFWGYGSKIYFSDTTTVLHGTSSYKSFFFVNGIVGVILVFIFYISILLRKYSRLGIGLLILVVICNMIRDYPYRLLWLYVYISGLVVLSTCKYDK